MVSIPQISFHKELVTAAVPDMSGLVALLGKEWYKTLWMKVELHTRSISMVSGTSDIILKSMCFEVFGRHPSVQR